MNDKTPGKNGWIERFLTAVTRESQAERMSRKLALAEPGLITMRDRLLVKMVEDSIRLEKYAPRQFAFEGAILTTDFDYVVTDRASYFHSTVDISSEHDATVGFVTSMTHQDRMLFPGRRIGVKLSDHNADEQCVAARIKWAGGLMERFTALYLATEFAKWQDLLDGEFPIPGRSDLIHRRRPERGRTIADVDDDLLRVRRNFKIDPSFTSKTLPVDLILFHSHRLTHLLENERSALLEKYYEDRGVDVSAVYGIYAPNVPKREIPEMKTMIADLDGQAKLFETIAADFFASNPALDQQELDEMVTDAMTSLGASAANQGQEAEEAISEAEAVASDWNNRGQSDQVSLLLALGYSLDDIKNRAEADETPELD